MSLSSSISNAFSGLTVTARAAQVVSSNLSNALNEDFSRREITLTSYHQGGAKFVNINRFVDRALTADLRNARSNLALTSEHANSTTSIAQAIGTPEDPNSLTMHLSRFDSSLRYLESDPSSTVRLQDTLASANAITDKLSTIEADIQRERQRADSQIASTISTLNTNLQQIETLNSEIVSANLNGHDTSTWLDERKRLVDEVSEIVPVREIRQDHGAVSLVSTNGMLLIERSAVQFEFSKTNVVMPHMTIASGDLGSLRLGADVINLDTKSGPLSGGRLQGLFDVRDRIAVSSQSEIDKFAFRLAEQFQDLPNDPSITINSPGLFTDNNARVNNLNETGLAGRLKVNANVDPSSGGELWRLRSGLNAAAQDAAGDTSLISDMISSISEASPDRSIPKQAADIVSVLAQSLTEKEKAESFATSHYEQLRSLHLENGVNTDAELQKLLQIETNYAANAKVMQTIDEMFAAILRIN